MQAVRCAQRERKVGSVISEQGETGPVSVQRELLAGHESQLVASLVVTGRHGLQRVDAPRSHGMNINGIQ